MDKIGKFEIIKELGKGATSAVYQAYDPFQNRQVAIKVVFPEALVDKEHGKRYRKLFVTEASLAGKLSHPHIVAIYDAVAGRRAELHRHGVRRGHDARAVHAPPEPAAGPEYRRDRLQVRAGAGLRRQTGRDPPRYQARKHPDDRRSGHQDLRFWRSVDARRGNYAALRSGFAGVHVPRAGEGAVAHASDRYFLTGRADVPAVDGPASVPGRQQLQHDLPDHQRGSAAAERAALRPVRRASTQS